MIDRYFVENAKDFSITLLTNSATYTRTWMVSVLRSLSALASIRVRLVSRLCIFLEKREAWWMV